MSVCVSPFVCIRLVKVKVINWVGHLTKKQHIYLVSRGYRALDRRERRQMRTSPERGKGTEASLAVSWPEGPLGKRNGQLCSDDWVSHNEKSY